MKNKQTRRGFTQIRHAELVSASSRYEHNKTLKQVQGDGRKGFTLIELLVVVLIIGILAAVAVPQYQKAVEKSRAVQAWVLLKSAYQAAENYRLANGSYPTDFEELDIDVPWTGTTKWYSSVEDKATRSNADWSLQLDNTKVAIGRISGPYAGGGFAMWYYDKGKLKCVERSQYGIVLEKPGQYCEKIFSAISLGGSSLREYRMSNY